MPAAASAPDQQHWAVAEPEQSLPQRPVPTLPVMVISASAYLPEVNSGPAGLAESVPDRHDAIVWSGLSLRSLFMDPAFRLR
jgi:hypothetical protein